MKHIVIDARSRPSSTGRYIDRLIEHLQKIDTDNNYTVLLRPSDNWQPINPRWQTKICKYKQFSFNPLNQITFAIFLYKLKPSLVHFGMTPQEPIFYFGRRATTTHDLTMLRFVRAGKYSALVHALRMAGYRFLFWWSHRAAKQIIVPTNFVAKDLARLHGFTKNKISVTYEASEPPLAVKSEKLKVKSLEGPFLLHVGSPFPHKNIERLIEAFKKLKAKHPDLKLVLPGKKEQYFEKLEELVNRSSVKDDVIIPGFVSDAELKWLYENAAAYVLPSLSEGFGLPGLEAMAHGCPLISSNATCLPEVYGEAAHYFNPEDIEDMTAKIDEVVSSQELRKNLIQKGYNQLKKYSWAKMAAQTLEIYQSTVSK